MTAPSNQAVVVLVDRLLSRCEGLNVVLVGVRDKLEAPPPGEETSGPGEASKLRFERDRNDVFAWSAGEAFARRLRAYARHYDDPSVRAWLGRGDFRRMAPAFYSKYVSPHLRYGVDCFDDAADRVEEVLGPGSSSPAAADLAAECVATAKLVCCTLSTSGSTVVSRSTDRWPFTLVVVDEAAQAVARADADAFAELDAARLQPRLDVQGARGAEQQ